MNEEYKSHIFILIYGLAASQEGLSSLSDCYYSSCCSLKCGFTPRSKSSVINAAAFTFPDCTLSYSDRFLCCIHLCPLAMNWSLRNVFQRYIHVHHLLNIGWQEKKCRNSNSVFCWYKSLLSAKGSIYLAGRWKSDDVSKERKTLILRVGVLNIHDVRESDTYSCGQ
jgi:hypothetical protein